MNKTLKNFGLLGLSTLLVTTASAQVVSGDWNYSWDGSLDGSNAGGTWTDVDMSMTTSLTANGTAPGGTPLYNWVSNDAFSLDVTLNHVGGITPTEALFAVITNDAAAPTTSDANWTALYFDPNGTTVYAAPYANDPFVDHQVTPFKTYSYTRTTTSSNTTFSLSLNSVQLGELGVGPGTSNWEGFGYPYDNDGETAGNSSTPYRMGIWMRSYAQGSVVANESGGKVRWDIQNPSLIGTFDDAEDFVKGPEIVPEPSSSLLLLLGASSMIFRRKKS